MIEVTADRLFHCYLCAICGLRMVILASANIVCMPVHMKNSTCLFVVDTIKLEEAAAEKRYFDGLIHDGMIHYFSLCVAMHCTGLLIVLLS